MAVPAYLTPSAKGVYLAVHAQPGARRPGLRGLHGEALKIAVREAAQDGKANAAIAATLAKALDVSKSAVQVVAGHQSRSKRVFIEGDADELQQRIGAWLETC